MARKLFVANLSPEVDQAALEKLFSSYGKVKWATVVMDPDTGKSKGFGFVEMNNEIQTQIAISKLDSKKIAGRVIQVSKAQSSGKTR